MAEFPATADIVIVGGGPAGSAAALTLLGYTKRRIVLVERGEYADPRPGETVSGALLPLFDYLDVPALLTRGGHLQAYGTQAAWGSAKPVARDFLFTSGGAGWHLDRCRFDRGLADAVERKGGTVLRGTTLRRIVREDGVWSLALEGRSGGTLAARAIIDATGRSGTVARRAGARRQTLDRLIGVVGYLQATADHREIQMPLIEACPGGWWYSAPLPEGRMVAAFMTDADLLAASRAATSGMVARPGFAERLDQAPLTGARLAGYEVTAHPRIWPAETGTLDCCVGDGWVAAGDAAMSFDPLSSLGIGHAIAGGIHVARILDRRLDGDEDLAATYAADLRRHLAAYLGHRQRLYGLEQRWPADPFWARRHASAAT